MKRIHYTITLLGLTSILIGQTSVSHAQQRLIQLPTTETGIGYSSPDHQDNLAKPLRSFQLVKEASSEPKFNGIPLSGYLRAAEKNPNQLEKFSQLLTIASKYSEAGQKDKALEILSQTLTIAETIEALPMRARAMARSYSHYAKAGQPDRATKGLAQSWQFVNKIEDINKAQAFLEIAREYAKTGQLARVTELLNRASEVTKTVFAEPFQQIQVLAEIGSEYLKVGEKDQAAEVLTRAIQIAKNAPSPKIWRDRRSTVFSKLASTSIAGGFDALTTQTVEITQAITTAEFKARTLIAIASEYAKAGQQEKAIPLLSESLEVAKTIELGGSSIGSVPMKIVVLLEIATQYGDIGQQSQAASVLTEARAVAQTLPENNKDTNSFESKIIAIAEIGSKYGSAGEKETGKKLLAQSLEMANNFSKKFASENNSAASPLFSRIANGYASLGEYDEALRVANTIKDIDFKANTFTEIASIYKSAGKQEQATQVLDKALQIAQTAKNKNGQGGLLMAIASQYLDMGQKEKAAQLLTQAFPLIKRQELSWFKFDTLTQIAQKFADTGQKAQATEVATSSLPESKTLKNYCARNEALMMISRMFVNGGQYERALEIAKSIDTCEYRSPAMSWIAIAYAKDGQYAQALQVATAIQSDDKIRSLSWMAMSYGEAGEYQQALQITRSLPANTLKVVRLIEIASNYATAGKQQEATALLPEILEIVNSFENQEFQAFVWTEIAAIYIEIAGIYITVGQQSSAEKLLEQAREMSKTLVAKSDKDSIKLAISKRDKILAEIAIKSLAMGRLEQAITSANTLEDAKAKVKLLVEIADFYTKSGEKVKAAGVLAKALKTAKTIEYEQSDALVAIATKYSSLEQYDQALKVVNSLKNAELRDYWITLLESAKKN